MPESVTNAWRPSGAKTLYRGCSVVVSTQLAFSYERGYFREGRARMVDSLRAYTAPTAAR